MLFLVEEVRLPVIVTFIVHVTAEDLSLNAIVRVLSITDGELIIVRVSPNEFVNAHIISGIMVKFDFLGL